MNFLILLIGNQTIHFSISFAFLQIQHTAMFPTVKNMICSLLGSAWEPNSSALSRALYSFGLRLIEIK